MGKRRDIYPGYNGTKRWRVQHPAYGYCFVISPSPDAALVAAAQVWQTKWTALDFYSACSVEVAG